MRRMWPPQKGALLHACWCCWHQRKKVGGGGSRVATMSDPEMQFQPPRFDVAGVNRKARSTPGARLRLSNIQFTEVAFCVWTHFCSLDSHLQSKLLPASGLWTTIRLKGMFSLELSISGAAPRIGRLQPGPSCGFSTGRTLLEAVRSAQRKSRGGSSKNWGPLGISIWFSCQTLIRGFRDFERPAMKGASKR